MGSMCNVSMRYKVSGTTAVGPVSDTEVKSTTEKRYVKREWYRNLRVRCRYRFHTVFTNIKDSVFLLAFLLATEMVGSILLLSLFPFFVEDSVNENELARYS